MGRGKRRATTTRSQATAARPLTLAVVDAITAAPDHHLHGHIDPQQVDACGHPHLEREEIENSSLLVGVGYDADRQILEAEFHDGGIYRYRGIPEDVYEGIFSAPSVGYYFTNFVIKGGYDHEAIHRAEYRETPEYLHFVKRHLNVDYVFQQDALEEMCRQLHAMPDAAISIDFECAIDSYSDKTRGCLRLVQLGVKAPKGEWFLTQEGKRTKYKQWVIDCFRVDPTSLIEVFQSDQEKLIHYLFFEQDWATGRFGSPIKNIFDSCLGWRGIQSYLTNSLRAADYATRGENIPRSIRRVLGCTVTRREYLDRYHQGLGFGEDGDFDQDAIYELSTLPQTIDSETGAEREMTQLEYAAWLDDEMPALGGVTEEENTRVAQKVLPFIADKLAAANFKTEPISSMEVVNRLAAPLGFAMSELGTDPDRAAAQLVKEASDLRLAPLPPLNNLTKLPDYLQEADEEIAVIAEALQAVEAQGGRGVKARKESLRLELVAVNEVRAQLLERWDAEKIVLAEENLEILEERARIKAQIAATPFIVPLEVENRQEWCAFPDFDHTKRAATSFHPNTLAFLSQKICGFDMPKTEQAGYWGRPTLTPSQITYAALDVAVLPHVVQDTKKIVAALGIEDDVYRRRIGGSEIRVAERVQGKMAKGDFVDHSEPAEIALRRATDLDELENAWHSLRTMALYAPSFKRLAGLYAARQKELKPRTPKKRRPRPAVAGVPF
jgi:hypothetical protein